MAKRKISRKRYGAPPSPQRMARSSAAESAADARWHTNRIASLMRPAQPSADACRQAFNHLVHGAEKVGAYQYARKGVQKEGLGFTARRRLSALRTIVQNKCIIRD